MIKKIAIAVIIFSVVVIAIIAIGTSGSSPSSSSSTPAPQSTQPAEPVSPATAPEEQPTQIPPAEPTEPVSPPAETGPSATTGEKNALRQAKEYLDYSAFSYAGLVEQLEYEGFSHEEAVYGADNCGADWN